MGDGADDGVERGVEVFAEILGEEAKHEAAVLLEQGVLAPVAAIGGRIGEVLWPVNLDGEFEWGTKQVGFEFAPTIEGDRQFGVQLEQAGCFG